MMALLEDIPMKISKMEDGIRVEAKEKSFVLNTERPLLAQVAEHLTIRYKMGQWLPPKSVQGLERLLAEQADGTGTVTQQE